MSYADYLGLKALLQCQRPLSGQHDEMLFITIHQASELWIKLCLHELTAAIRQIREGELGPAFKMLSRIARVQMQLIQSWEILSTMTPFDYVGFRDSLGQSSGFQSFQYRMLEFRLGNKNAKMARVFESDSELAGLTPGTHRLSPLLADLVGTALDAAEASSGLVDPTVGSTMRYVRPSATFIEDAYRRAVTSTISELTAEEAPV